MSRIISVVDLSKHLIFIFVCIDRLGCRSISPAADCATKNVEPNLSELENLPAEDYDDCDGIMSNAEEMDEGEDNFVADVSVNLFIQSLLV